MISFLTDNIGTILVSLVLILIVVLVIRQMIKDKKSGKVCNGNCGSCHGCSQNNSNTSK